MSIFEDTFLVGDSQEVLKEVDDGIVHLTCLLYTSDAADE